MIKTNNELPSVSVKIIKNNDIKEINFKEYASYKKLVVFAVPGAFTPTCNNSHLPHFISQIDAFKKKGVDEIICLAVNDAFVLKVWAAHHKAENKVTFMADGNAEVTRALGMILDATPFGMGVRSQRYSMYVDNGIIRLINVEPSSGACIISDASALLSQIS